jgi:hypothetical protein
VRRIKASFVLSLLLLISCKAGHHKKDLSFNDYGLPPNTIKLSDNLFIDKTEISNFAYLEFLYWNYKLYGKTDEYLDLLPDTMKWMDLGDFYHELPLFYLRHPEYRNHPVVNITREQALKFTKWRSDRVMEFILIKSKVFERAASDKESVFTIEKYFSGNYRNMIPDQRFNYYPEFSLPDSVTYVKALRASDSMYVEREKFCKSKYCEDEIFTINCLQNIKDRTDSLLYGRDPVNSTECKFCKTSFITHLQGNVAEFTDRSEVIFGASFKDNCEKVYSTYFFVGDSSANCYTGFRNKCTWKKWEKKK